MKIILLQDVKKIGAKGDIVSVSDGYALHLLIPKGLAKEATKKNLKLKSESDSKQKATLEKDRLGTEKLLESIPENIDISVKSNEEGILFATLTEDLIKKSISEKFSLSLDKVSVKILDDKPIKKLGEHEIEIGSGDINKKISVNVK